MAHRVINSHFNPLSFNLFATEFTFLISAKTKGKYISCFWLLPSTATHTTDSLLLWWRPFTTCSYCHVILVSFFPETCSDSQRFYLLCCIFLFHLNYDLIPFFYDPNLINPVYLQFLHFCLWTNLVRRGLCLICWAHFTLTTLCTILTTTVNADIIHCIFLLWKGKT